MSTLPLRRAAYGAALGGLKVLRSRDWAEASATDVSSPGSLTVTGFLSEVLGIGRAGRLTADVLERHGAPVMRDDLRSRLRGLLTQAPVPLPGGEGGVWLVHANAPEADLALLRHRASDWGGRYRIGYWAWETPRAPAGWARTARRFHEIWAPSRFVADALATSGVPEAKLRVVPHPVPVRDRSSRRDRFGLEDGRLEALVMFDGRSAYARKNPWGAIEAWRLAFPEPTDARLTVKAVNLDADPASARRLSAMTAERPDLRLYTERLDDRDTDDLVACVDLFVSLHRAEGFGLVPAEAMGAGVAVVATAWSGNLDFMDAESAALVPAGLAPVRDPSGAYRGDRWAEPDLRAAADAIRALAADPDRRRALGEAGRRRIAALEPTFLAAWADSPASRLVRR